MNAETSSYEPHGAAERAADMGGKRAQSAARGKSASSPSGGDSRERPDESAAAAAGGGDDPKPSAQAAGNSRRHAGKEHRAHDGNRLMTEVKEFVQENPVPSLIGAAILGFVLARMLSRD